MRLTGLLLLMVFMYLTTARVVEQAFTQTSFKTQKNWIYLDKMVLSPGNVSIQFQTIFNGDSKQPIQIEFGIIKDQFFETQNRYRCENAENKITTYPHSLYPYKKPSTSRISMGNYAEHLYYFVMRDCSMQLQSNKTIGGYVIKTKLTIINADSHLGSQDDLWYICPILIIILVGLAARIWKQKPMGIQKNWIQILLLVAVISRILGLFWKVVGHFIYWFNGKNKTAYEIFYLGLHGLSEVMIISIVVLISFGWYILFVNHDDFDIIVALTGLLGSLNIIMNILNVINDDSAEKYHMYDTVSSTIQTIFRIIALACLIGGIKNNWSKFTSERKSFIIEFGIYGAIYIMSLPITIFLATLFKKSDRKEAVFLMSEFFQLISLVYLSYQLVAKNSSYKRINIENTSFVPESHQNEKFF